MRFSLLLASFLLLLWGCGVGSFAGKPAALVDVGVDFDGAGSVSRSEISTIAFGSCLRQWGAQPVWRSISALKPDAFLFLGDNVYTDVGDYLQQAEPQRIQQAYRDLNNSAEFGDFVQHAESHGTRIFAVWDDHDYGRNDAGSEYPHKLASKQYFLDFFSLDKVVTDRDEPGLYYSDMLTLENVKIQFLFLDTRSFRSALTINPLNEKCPRINFGVNLDQEATLLGEAQWQWLERELSKPADMRLLVSSIQVLPTEHCYEKWANFPNERDRLINLLRSKRAQGVIILSGDRHLGEISKLPKRQLGYPVYEITSSGLNTALGPESDAKDEPNHFRVKADNVLANNFGAIQLLAVDDDVEIKLQLRDQRGLILQQQIVYLSQLLN